MSLSVAPRLTAPHPGADRAAARRSRRPVPALHRHRRLIGEPAGDGGRLPVGQQVDRPVTIEVNHDGAVAVAAPYGKQVPLEALREVTGTNRDGVDALAITQAAQRYGLRARGAAADLDDLKQLPPATILHWAFAHFVVFQRLRENGAQVMDRALGRRRLSMEVFRRSYTGVAITFEPGEDFRTGRVTTKGTWRYLRPLLGQSRRLARVLVGSVLLRLLALALPLLTGLLVDEIVPRKAFVTPR